MNKICLILFLGWGMQSVAAFGGEPIVLFRSVGVPVANYESLLGGLKRGDQIAFSDGAVFEVRRVLDTEREGRTSFFVATGDGFLIRMPRGQGVFVAIQGNARTYRDIHAGMLESALQLASVRTVDIDFKRSLPGERILVRELQMHGTVADLVRFGKNLNPVIRERYIDMVRDWMASAWQLESIGDFSLDQLAITDAGVTLMDWNAPVVKAGSLEDGTLLSFAKRVVMRRAKEVGDLRMNSPFEVLPNLAAVAPDNPWFEEALLMEINKKRIEAGWPKKAPPCSGAVRR